jgi:predicted aspartyl protease
MLYLVKQEFTYVPNARINVNRSRIDFFLIDTGMAEGLVDCKISSAVSSTSFDHKKINLTLGKLVKVKNFNKIDEKLIKHTGINTLIKTKILENYIIHADPESVPCYISTNILIDCGRIERLVSRIRIRKTLSWPRKFSKPCQNWNFSKIYLYPAVKISFLKA